MTCFRLFLSPLLAATALGALPAQDPSDRVASAALFQDEVVPIHSAPDDLGLPYGTWAAGSDYKVSFHDGMVFVPYLGSEAPQNMPLRWTTVSVSVGGRALPLQTPIHSHSNTRYEYDLGPVVEAYDVRPEGLEQTFVLASAPAGFGDLVVRGRIESPLTAPPAEAAHSQLVFTGSDGRARVSYGAATAIDASGARFPMTTAHAGGEIELRLEDRWLREAAFPLTVDPLIGNTSLFTGIARVRSLDVVHERESPDKQIWLVYSLAASAADSDLWFRRIDQDFAGPSRIVFADLTTSWSTDDGRCAYVNGPDKGIAVFSRFFPPLMRMRLRWHAHARSDPAMNTMWSGLSPAISTAHDWRPDVGGTLNEPGPNALVVWQRDDSGGSFANTPTSSCHYALLDLSGGGQGTLGPVQTLHANPDQDVENPSVNQVAKGGLAFSWLAAFEAFQNNIASDDLDVCLRQISDTGAGSQLLCVEPTAPYHKFGPIVEGMRGRYSVVYMTDDDLSRRPRASGARLHLQRIDWSHGQPRGSFPHPASVIVPQQGGARWTPFGLAFDTDTRSHWTPLYINSVHTSAHPWGEVHVQRVGFSGQILRDHMVWLGAPGQIAYLGAASFNTRLEETVILFDTITSSGRTIRGDRLTYPQVPAAAATGASCSSATIAWDGRGNALQEQHLGSEFTGPNVTGAPAGALHVMLLSLAPADLPVAAPGIAPGCRLLVSTGPGFVGALDVALGASASWTIPLPEFLPPTTLYLQDWHTDPTAGAFVSTQRLVVPVVK